MKSKVLLLLIALTIGGMNPVTAAALDDRNEFGMGLLLGEPSGINAQFFWTSKSALDFTGAWSWRDWFFVSADYQIYDYILDSPREWKWYYGLGAYLTIPENEDGTIGARIPLGVKYHFPHSPIDFWAEVAPALQIAPDTEPELQGGLGVTFWIR